mgnify:FL=1
MTAGLRLPQPKRPEWLHSGRYFLLALLLHLAVVLYPLPLAVDKLEVTPPSPLIAKLQEKVSASQVIPPAMPEKAPKQVKPPREKPAPRPIIAMTPEKASPPAAFTVPAPVVALPVPPPPANNSAPPAPPAAAVSAVRFDAAYLHNPHPAYPPISRRMGEEGKVLLKVRVMPDGRAAAVNVEKSSNFERLDEAARQSVANWRFVPAKRGDEAIEASVIVPIVFRLEN